MICVLESRYECCTKFLSLKCFYQTSYMMNFNFVFNRTRNLIINPKTEWNNIRLENFTKDEVVRKYAFPMIIIMAACSIVGSIITVSNIGYAIIKAIGIFGFTYIGTYISAVIINELTTSFNSKKDLSTTFRLVIYSLTAYYVMVSLVLLWPPLGMLSVFGLFSIYLFWEGSTILLDTPEDNKIGFVVVSTLVIAGVYSILYLILAGILTALFTAKLIVS